MNLNSAIFAPARCVWACELSGFANRGGAKVDEFCTLDEISRTRLNSGGRGTAGQAGSGTRQLIRTAGQANSGTRGLVDKPNSGTRLGRSLAVPSTLHGRARPCYQSSPHSTLDSQLAKMGFVQNVANWSRKTQVRNSPAMFESDWKTSGFCKLSERQKSGFCPLQSCWLFRGQNGQNDANARGHRQPHLRDLETSAATARR